MSEDLEPVIEKNFKISYDGKLNIKILDIDELKSYFFNYLKILIVDILIESLKIEYHYHGSNKEYVMDVLENNPWIKEIDINNEWENILRNYLNNKDYITFFRRTFGLETITPREDWKKLKKYQVDYIPEDWSKVDNYRELSTMMYFIDSPEYKVKNSTIIVRTQDEFIELFKSTVVMNDRQQLRKDILIKKYEEGYDISLFDDVEKNIEYLLEDTLKKLKNKKIDIFDFE